MRLQPAQEQLDILLRSRCYTFAHHMLSTTARD
jgi:hypothetical protein